MSYAATKARLRPDLYREDYTSIINALLMSGIGMMEAMKIANEMKLAQKGYESIMAQAVEDGTMSKKKVEGYYKGVKGIYRYLKDQPTAARYMNEGVRLNAGGEPNPIKPKDVTSKVDDAVDKVIDKDPDLAMYDEVAGDVVSGKKGKEELRKTVKKLIKGKGYGDDSIAGKMATTAPPSHMTAGGFTAKDVIDEESIRDTISRVHRVIYGDDMLVGGGKKGLTITRDQAILYKKVIDDARDRGDEEMVEYLTNVRNKINTASSAKDTSSVAKTGKDLASDVATEVLGDAAKETVTTATVDVAEDLSEEAAKKAAEEAAKKLAQETAEGVAEETAKKAADAIPVAGDIYDVGSAVGTIVSPNKNIGQRAGALLTGLGAGGKYLPIPGAVPVGEAVEKIGKGIELASTFVPPKQTNTAENNITRNNVRNIMNKSRGFVDPELERWKKKKGYGYG